MKIKAAPSIIVTAIISSGLTLTQANANERPPENAKPLVEIVEDLEAQGYAPITEISLDNGVWEVEAYKGNEERELKVDPISGKVLSDRKDD